MTATAASRVKDQELMPFGLVESGNVNSFADFVPSNLYETEANEKMEKNIPRTLNIKLKNNCFLIVKAILAILIKFFIIINTSAKVTLLCDKYKD